MEEVVEVEEQMMKAEDKGCKKKKRGWEIMLKTQYQLNVSLSHIMRLDHKSSIRLSS